MSNPYAITFGSKPELYIPRIEQREQVIQAFNREPSPTHAYVIVGVRGSGKTVLLSDIAKKIGEDWVVVDISSQSEMLRSLTSQLYGEESVHKLFVKAELDFSFMGLGVHAEESKPAFDYQTAIKMMLTELKKQHKKVLVTVDEVDNSSEMRLFASVFQIYIRNDLPIYMLMAGIPENIYGLMNEKHSTFLLRTPRIMMTPLNFSMVKRSYIKELQVDEETAEKLAILTNGYPFAYQALGYVCWGKLIQPGSESFDEILLEYDFYLQEFSYQKIWDEMSGLDKKLAREIAKSGPNAKVRELRYALEMDSSSFGVYRERLIRKGIINGDIYGEVSFTLPRFAEFVRDIPTDYLS